MAPSLQPSLGSFSAGLVVLAALCALMNAFAEEFLYRSAFIGGWIFAKAMVEARGMGWPLFLHLVSDFTVYLVILISGGF